MILMLVWFKVFTQPVYDRRGLGIYILQTLGCGNLFSETEVHDEKWQKLHG